MQIQHLWKPAGLAAFAMAGSLLFITTPSFSQPAAGDAPAPIEEPAARQQHLQQRAQERLLRMAERLQLDAGQQDAWAAYTKAVEGLIGKPPERPPVDADAATVTRFRAQLAAGHAQKMAQLADATANLQQVLRPEQREVLNEMVRHAGTGMGPHEGHRRHGPRR